MIAGDTCKVCSNNRGQISCLNSQGERMWRYHLNSVELEGQQLEPRVALLLMDDQLIAADFASGALHALDEHGNRLWRYVNWGRISPPVLQNDTLILASSFGEFLRLSRDGELLKTQVIPMPEPAGKVVVTATAEGPLELNVFGTFHHARQWADFTAKLDANTLKVLETSRRRPHLAYHPRVYPSEQKSLTPKRRQSFGSTGRSFSETQQATGITVTLPKWGGPALEDLRKGLELLKSGKPARDVLRPALNDSRLRVYAALALAESGDLLGLKVLLLSKHLPSSTEARLRQLVTSLPSCEQPRAAKTIALNWRSYSEAESVQALATLLSLPRQERHMPLGLPRCYQALTRISGVPLGNDPAKWEVWWHSSQDPELLAYKASLDRPQEPRFSAAEFAAWTAERKTFPSSYTLVVTEANEIEMRVDIDHHELASDVEAISLSASSIFMRHRDGGLSTLALPSRMRPQEELGEVTPLTGVPKVRELQSYRHDERHGYYMRDSNGGLWAWLGDETEGRKQVADLPPVVSIALNEWGRVLDLWSWFPGKTLPEKVDVLRLRTSQDLGRGNAVIDEAGAVWHVQSNRIAKIEGLPRAAIVAGAERQIAMIAADGSSWLQLWKERSVAPWQITQLRNCIDVAALWQAAYFVDAEGILWEISALRQATAPLSESDIVALASAPITHPIRIDTPPLQAIRAHYRFLLMLTRDGDVLLRHQKR